MDQDITSTKQLYTFLTGKTRGRPDCEILLKRKIKWKHGQRPRGQREVGYQAKRVSSTKSRVILHSVRKMGKVFFEGKGPGP
jgi:hypothetical protein